MKNWIFVLFVASLCWPAISFGQSGQQYPGLVEGPINWRTVSGLNDNFNRKDAVMGILRQTGQIKFFVNETERNYVEDFHFLNLRGDIGSETVYSGQTAERGWYTYIFTSENYRYRVAFEAPGYLHSLTPQGDNWSFVVRDDPEEGQYLSRISRHIFVSDSEKDSLVSELVFPGVTEPPTTRLKTPVAMQIGAIEWLRHSPKIINDPIFDYNKDGRPDGQGNRIAAFRVGHPAIKVGLKEVAGVKWAFVIVPVKDPAPGHVLGEFLPGITYTAGWLPAEILR